MKQLLFISLFTLLISSCSSERSKNEKIIKDANELIDKAGLSEEKILDIPLGFRLGWTIEQTKKHIDSLKQKGAILSDSFPVLMYKYPNYKGLHAEVELFFVSNNLARMAFQLRYKTEYMGEFTREYPQLLRFLYLGDGTTNLDYKIPIDSIDDESNWDEVSLGVKKNFVVMFKEIKYSTFLQTEKVFIFSNQPKAKELPEYKTRKEIEKGGGRFDDIKQHEKWVKENEEQIKNAAYRMDVKNDSYDGSVWQVKEFLDKTLKDPDSYECIEWGNVVHGSMGYSVRHKYRAKNSFGGYVIEEHTYQIDIEGNVVGVIE